MPKVDVPSRRRLAVFLRRFVTGRLTDIQYEEAVGQSVEFTDPAIRAVYRASLDLCSDTREQRLSGENALSREGKREVAKALLFLYTDLEYRWPSFREIAMSLLYGLTGGRFGLKGTDEPGDEEAWPFFTTAELKAIVKKPVQFEAGKGFCVPPRIRPIWKRLFSYHVIAKVGMFLPALLIWALFDWRSFGYSRSELLPILGCVLFVTIILSLPRRMTSSNLTWWQIILILGGIFLVPALTIYLLVIFSR